MANDLRRKYVRVCFVSITAVLVFFNIAIALISYANLKNNEVNTLSIIEKNEGKLPAMIEKRYFNVDIDPDTRGLEDAYRTRYFVIRYNKKGRIIQSDLNYIASVSDYNLENYVRVASKNGEGYGVVNYYRYLVVDNGGGLYTATFLDIFQDITLYIVGVVIQLIALVICDAVVFLFLNLASEKIVEPFIENNKRQKQFITNASHELKTPITVISTSLKVLELENGKQKWIDKAQYQVTKLTDLVNELVTLSKLNEDESPMHFKAFNLTNSLAEVIDSFNDFAKEKGLILKSNIEDNLNINGDEYYIKLMISTLIDNAIKYSEKETITINLKKSNKDIELSISNNVKDIKQEDAARLFERFYRSNDEKTSEVKGSGIGLSIAKQIVEGHKGKITANIIDNDKIEFKIKLKEKKI